MGDFLRTVLFILDKIDVGETKSNDYLYGTTEKQNWLFFVVRNYYNIANNRIGAKKAVHCFQKLTSSFCKVPVQTIL